VIRDDTAVRLGWIELLDQVIPTLPFPNDVRGIDPDQLQLLNEPGAVQGVDQPRPAARPG
jgi:hypothetical protein